MAQETAQMYIPSGGGKGQPDVIYYRNRRGWITWGDTQASKQINLMQKGCVPLPQYGKITHSADLWGPILRHPDGPAEFPLDQVLTYRWYRKDQLPDLRPIVMHGRDEQRVGAQPRVNFPQLAGVKIIEFPCPECSRYFHQPTHLGSHLRVMHEYDRSEIIKYGEAMNIDFSRVPGGKQLVEFDFTNEEIAAQEVEQDRDDLFEVATVSPETPASSETRYEVEQVSCDQCDWVSREGGSRPEFALMLHKKGKHAEAVPA